MMSEGVAKSMYINSEKLYFPSLFLVKLYRLVDQEIREPCTRGEDR